MFTKWTSVPVLLISSVKLTDLPKCLLDHLTKLDIIPVLLTFFVKRTDLPRCHLTV